MDNSIFKIDNSRSCFYQWDIGQKLVVLDNSVSFVNYQAEGQDEAYKIPVVSGRAQVPDELLQTAGCLVVWAMVYDGSQYTKTTATFGIIARQKPSDYVNTPTEYETFASKLDKNFGSENAGKYLAVADDGEVEAADLVIPEPSTYWLTDLDDYDYRSVYTSTFGECYLGASKNADECFFCVDDWDKQLTADVNEFVQHFFGPIYNFFATSGFRKDIVETTVSMLFNSIDYYANKGIMPDWSSTTRTLAVNYINVGNKGYITYSSRNATSGIFKTVNFYVWGYNTGNLSATRKPDGTYTIIGRKDNNVKEFNNTNKYFKTDANGYSTWVAENKLDANLGSANSGKYLQVGANGDIQAQDLVIPEPSAYWTTDFDDYDFKEFKEYTTGKRGCLLGVSKNADDCFFCVDDWYDQLVADNFQSHFFAPIYNFFYATGDFTKFTLENTVSMFLNNIEYQINKGIMPDWDDTKRTLAINYYGAGNKGYISYKLSYGSKVINVYMGGYNTGRLNITITAEGKVNISGWRDNGIKDSFRSNCYYKLDANGYSTWVEENKLDANLGTENEGKVLTVSATGDVAPTELEIPQITKFLATDFDDFDFRDFSGYSPLEPEIYLGISKDETKAFFCDAEWETKLKANFQPLLWGSIHNIFCTVPTSYSTLLVSITSLFNKIEALISSGMMPDWSTTHRILAINCYDYGNSFKGIIRYRLQGQNKVLVCSAYGGKDVWVSSMKKADDTYTVLGYKNGLTVRDLPATPNAYLKTDADGLSQWVQEDLAQKPFVAIFSGTDANNDAACDKTYAEIKAAYDAGREIQLKYQTGNTLYYDLNKYIYVVNDTDINFNGNYLNIQNMADINDGYCNIRCHISNNNLHCTFDEV